MARSTTESGANNTDQLTFQANGAERIELPSSDFIADAEMTRDGDNLILETPNGEVAVIEGYFSADPAPLLASPDGSVLTPNLVQAFAHSPMEFAANDTASDESPIGAVEEVKGNVTVKRADGTVESVAIGTPIYQGDVVETDANGAVNIVFMDDTSMAISENARMAIDEYTYDPATESGTTNFSVLRGLFVFTSGLIGRDDPDDVKIDTPVGSIGIRGTIIAGEINPNGESNITVLEGAIVITNGDGNITLSNAFETVTLQGFNAPMSTPVVLPAAEINARFSSVSAVNPSLFSTISEAVQEQQSQQPAPAAEAPTAQEAPQSQMQPQNAPASSPAANEAPVPQAAPVMDVPVVQDQTIAPAPVEASPPVTMADPSVSGFGTNSTGLPSVNIVAGQSSAGTFDSSANTVPVAGPAPAGMAPIMPPPPAGAPLGATIGSTMPPPAGTIQQPPPAVIAANAPQPPGPNLGITVGGNVKDTDVSGTLVARVAVLNTTDPWTYTLTNNGGSTYQMSIVGGVAVITLSTTPTQFVQNLEVTPLPNFQITASFTDTLGTTHTLVRSFGVTVTDANINRVIDLDSNITGVTMITDDNGNAVGYSVSALGDINNDGFDDFVFTNNTTSSGQNHSYIVHGSASGIPNGSIPDLITGSTISIRGNTTNTTNFSQTVVSGIGDFNGDGVEDYLVGQTNNITSGAGSGAASIINGDTFGGTPFTTGVSASLGLGSDVAGIGDINNDGFADIVIGGPGSTTGTAFIIKGSTSISTALSAPTTITGTATGDDFGESVTGLGDFNGDGYADFAIGSPGASGGQGLVRIYEGQKIATPTTHSLQLSNGADTAFGSEIEGIGDINGDGYSDLMVGTGTNRGYVYFGGAAADATADVNFNVGVSYNVIGGGKAGDFNGDGFDDFAMAIADTDDTKIYVVLGKGAMPTNITEAYLKNPDNAFELQFDGLSGVEVTSIGDANGDGYDDLAIGMPDAAAGDGSVAIVNGRASGNITAGLAASADNQHLVGNAANNIFNDGANDGVSMRGGAGNDLFNLNNTNFLSIDGGSGLLDRIVMSTAASGLNFSAVNFERISGIENIVFGNNGQTMTLTMENIFNLLKTSDNGTLRIDLASGVTGFSLILDDQNGATNPANDITGIQAALNEMGNAAQYVTASAATDYDAFKIGGYTLYINDDITAATTVT